MKKRSFAFLAGALCAACTVTSVRAEFLFHTFIVPSDPSADRSSWDVFYTPYNGANYPDVRATYGTRQTASSAGFTVPDNSAPSDPAAYFDTRNPTITQSSNSDAFIIDPGNAGNIYSFSGPTAYRLDNSTANYSTPYDVGTVAFQFQTAGTLIDFNSIQLQYTDSTNVVHTLAPNELLREYRGDTGSSFGGLTNRTAVQWDLSGLGIRTYRLLFNAAGSSSSFQVATLATTASAGEIVPGSRVWSTGGSGNWSSGFSNPQGTAGQSPNADGNVRFVNTAPVTTALDAGYTIGELRFATPAAVTVNSPGNLTLTANTGITTTAAATGTYTVGANYALGAFNVFDLAAGEVIINGTVSGGYGFEKDGAGTLTLNGSNTFTGSVSVGGGSLRINHANAYSGATTVLQGALVLGGDAPGGAAGTLGNAATAVTVGADSTLFTFPGQTPSASLVIDGNYTVGRDVTFAAGSYEKRLAATNASGAGAVFGGGVNLAAATDVKFTATNATDRLIFNGAITGGSSGGAVTLDGAGTVIFSGAAKNYASATNVNKGMLQLAAGAAFSGSGALNVASGAALVVDGTLGGSGALTLAGGSVLSGGGTVNRVFAVGAGAALSPGNGVGTLNTAGQTWAGGGTYRLELSSAVGIAGSEPGNDLVRITGDLSLSGTATNRFTLQLRTVRLGGGDGMLAGFDPNSNYVWQIAVVSGRITGFDAGVFQVDTSGFADGYRGGFGVSSDGSSLYLNYTAIPETFQSGWIVGGILAVIAVARRRGRSVVS